jgi:hypothetical protein
MVIANGSETWSFMEKLRVLSIRSLQDTFQDRNVRTAECCAILPQRHLWSA